MTENNLPGIKYPEQARVYTELFAPGELLDIKNKGETLIDPLPITARFWGEVPPQDAEELVSILSQYNPAICFQNTKDGPRIYANRIEELLRGCLDAAWEVTLRMVPEKTRKATLTGLQMGIEAVWQQMQKEDRERREEQERIRKGQTRKREEEWGNNSSS